MCTLHGAASDIQRRCKPAIDAEMCAAYRTADDVDDGVDGADLVEMHLLDGHGVDA